MSVVVTGGAGYIGSHMVWALVDRGEDVVVVDDLSKGFDWAVAPEAELVVADIGDQTAMEALFRSRKTEAIIHFAGSVVVPESVQDPLGYYLNNTVKSRAWSLRRSPQESRISSFPRPRRFTVRRRSCL